MFTKNNIKPGHDSSSKKGGRLGNVAFHASRISDRSYQVVVIDRQNNIQDAIDVANDAYYQLMKANKLQTPSNRFYVWVEESGTGPPSFFKTYEIHHNC